jgi:hypothetical protein
MASRIETYFCPKGTSNALLIHTAKKKWSFPIDILPDRVLTSLSNNCKRVALAPRHLGF